VIFWSKRIFGIKLEESQKFLTVKYMLDKLKRLLIAYFDVEMISIKKIILRTPTRRKATCNYSSLMEECDKVFIDRFYKFPVAYKLKFWENHFELTSFDKFPEIKGHILDFGCGTGHLDILLAQKGLIITGLDASPIAIEIANHLKSKTRKEVSCRLEFIEGEIPSPNLFNFQFDSVWSTQVFEHISNPKEIIDGVKQFVKKGAFYLMCVPLGYAYDDPGHINHFNSGENFVDFISPYISVIRVEVDNANNVIRCLCKF
jgi:SAM-dependent methyltransferase